MTDIRDLSRLCVHTRTTQPWSVDEAAQAYGAAGVSGMTLWRDVYADRDPGEVGAMVRGCGLRIVALCRGGFFPHALAKGRQEAIEDNKRAIEEAAQLGAPQVVLVCGAVPGQALELSRRQIRDGIEAVLPHAEQHDIQLAIEPLHPMYADDRSALTTLGQANDMAEAIDSAHLGVALDVYHLWWDPDLQAQIKRCGAAGNLLAFHICDWKTPTTDLLVDRGLMGEGCIDIPLIRGWVEAAGFQGFHEVEIFSTAYWQMDQTEFLEKIKQAYLEHA